MVKICFTGSYPTSKRIVLQNVPHADHLTLLSLNSHFEAETLKSSKEAKIGNRFFER